VKAAIMGAGSWGTTFGQVLCDAGTEAVVCCRRPELARVINETHENPDYLPGVPLTADLRAEADPAAALDRADLVIFAVPAQSLRENLRHWAPLLPGGAQFVSLIKGIELDTCKRMSEVIAEVLDVAAGRIGAVSGPNLAREIAQRQYAASVVACPDERAAVSLQQACHTPYFRPYTNTDVVGCELGGAVKNVIALAVGIAVAMDLGDNTRAMLITRGLAEIARLGAALGASPQTFAGLAGLGDLVATCASPLSRNRTFGENVGRGMSVADASSMSGQVAEGVKSSEAVLALARKHGVEMPITEVVAAVVHDGLPVSEAAIMLASRSAKPEWYGS
jgi:glycerol-3-phosphate dehydrogenase (NAD(P)+)